MALPRTISELSLALGPPPFSDERTVGAALRPSINRMALTAIFDHHKRVRAMINQRMLVRKNGLRHVPSIDRSISTRLHLHNCVWGRAGAMCPACAHQESTLHLSFYHQ